MATPLPGNDARRVKLKGVAFTCQHSPSILQTSSSSSKSTAGRTGIEERTSDRTHGHVRCREVVVESVPPLVYASIHQLQDWRKCRRTKARRRPPLATRLCAAAHNHHHFDDDGAVPHARGFGGGPHIGAIMFKLKA